MITFYKVVIIIKLLFQFGSNGKTILLTAEAISSSKVFKYPLTETPHSCKYVLSSAIYFMALKSFIRLSYHFEAVTFPHSKT